MARLPYSAAFKRREIFFRDIDTGCCKVTSSSFTYRVFGFVVGIIFSRAEKQTFLKANFTVDCSYIKKKHPVILGGLSPSPSSLRPNTTSPLLLLLLLLLLPPHKTDRPLIGEKQQGFSPPPKYAQKSFFFLLLPLLLSIIIVCK